jgi:hypothetical protein
MADISNNISMDQVQALIANAIAGLPTSFVGGGTAMTIADLMTNFPPAVAYKGLYARVNNLYNNVGTATAGGVDDIVRCRFDAANGVYRWVPQREAFNVSITPTGGTTTLTPLVTPPTVRLAGTLVGNLTINPLVTNAYVGQVFQVIQNSTLGLFVTTITGLLGSNVTLLGNTSQLFEYTATGWVKGNP